ncbi:MAG: ABC transporter permease [Verrucomicrobia bacterium]|nr:ABC transporter permease [Verrucomicrobiota bacterium]
MRSLLRSPGFTLTVLLTLALGIGANTAIFTVVNAVLLRPLPFEEPGQLVAIGSNHATRPSEDIGPVSYPDFADFRAQARSFQDLALHQGDRVSFRAGTGEFVSLIGRTASSSIFDVLRVRMALGRGFEPDDDTPGKGQVVVLSQSVWKRLFASDPGIVGRDVTMNGRSWTVRGILPAGFQFPFDADQTEVWMPLGTQRVTPDGSKPWTEERGSHSSSVVGRLKPGVSAETASAELRSLAAGLAQQYPNSNTNFSARAVPLGDELVRDVRTALLVLFGSVGCVLLIACANVANLCLVRATGQRRELAIRAALGAGRRRLILEMLRESLVLAVLGGAAGLLLAHWGTAALLALVPDSIPRASTIGLDWNALVFTLSLSLLTGVGFGLVPAWQASRVDVNDALKDGGRGLGGGRQQARVRHTLVAAQIVLSLVLLVGAGLLLQSFDRLLRQSPGFDLRPLVSFRVNLPDQQYPRPELIADFQRRLQTALRERPEIAAASITQAVPLSGSVSRTSVDIGGRELPPGQQVAEFVRVVGDDYLKTLGLSLRGREFTPQDTLTSPPVALVNEAFARKHFGGNALGQRINAGMSAGDQDSLWREIVGVVPDFRQIRASREPEPEMYLPQAQVPWTYFGVVVRARSDVRSAQAAAIAELAKLDPTVPPFRVLTLQTLAENAAARSKFNGLLLSLFSGVALLLTAVGIYGVMAHTVAQRRGEIGLRMALGASSGSILQLVVRHALILTAIGVGLGLGAAYGATRLLGSLLYGIQAFDPLTFGLVSLGLFLTTAAAAALPARRAARTDPATVLRSL